MTLNVSNHHGRLLAFLFPRMQRSGTEAIRTQIQPSKSKREITNNTNSQNTKRRYGQPSEQLFSSPEPKAQGELIVYQSSRRLSVCLSVNIFKLEYLCNQWANRNKILSEPSLG